MIIQPWLSIITAMIIIIFQQPWLSNIIVMKMIIIIIQPWLSNIIAMITIIINQPCSPQLASDCLFLSLAPSEANKERLSQGESGDGDGSEWWLSQWLQRWLWLGLNLVYVCGKEAGGRWRGHTPASGDLIIVTSPFHWSHHHRNLSQDHHHFGHHHHHFCYHHHHP